MDDKPSDLKEMETIINFSDINVNLEESEGDKDKLDLTFIVEGEAVVGKKVDRDFVESVAERRKKRLVGED